MRLEYTSSGIKAFGNEDFTDKIENMTTSRITLTDKDGNVLLDNEADPANEKSQQPSGIYPGNERRFW